MILSRRFLPYFITQCLGALNDNVYKNVLLLLVTYSQLKTLPIDVNLFVNLAAGLFILPFFLFSAHAGLIADNIDKAILIRRLKLLEVIIMCCGAAAIMTHSYLLMLLLLFLMGTQSAFFGPVKYSLLPRVLLDIELVRGNAWVEMGTFISILVGTITAGLIVASDHANIFASFLVVILALIGYISSRFIPLIPTTAEVKKIRFTPFSGLISSIKRVKRSPSIWAAIMAISWFWFLGATYLTQFPNFAKLHLHSGATVVSLLLALFSIGIAAGSFLCDRLSFRQVELGILPFGLLGLAIFGVDLYLAVPSKSPEVIYSALTFIAEPQHYRLMFDLFMVGVSGGLFIVPLYAFIQARSNERECAQAIAANNIMNALFMVVSAVFAIIFLGVLGASILQLFLLLAIANLLFSLFLYTRLPELRLRFVCYLFGRFINPLAVKDRKVIPARGSALLIGDLTSAKDFVLLQSLTVNPIQFLWLDAPHNGFFINLLRSASNIIEGGDTTDKQGAPNLALIEQKLTQSSHSEQLIYVSHQDWQLLGDDLKLRLSALPQIAISLSKDESKSKQEEGSSSYSGRVYVELTLSPSAKPTLDKS